MLAIKIINGKLSESSTTLLNHALTDYPPEELALSEGLNINWQVLSGDKVIYHAPEGLFVAEAVCKNKVLEGIKYSWRQGGKNRNETVMFTPMQKMILGSYMKEDVPRAGKVEITDDELEDIIDEPDENFDDFSPLPYTPQEFVDRLSPICCRCENTVKNYIEHHNPENKVIFIHGTKNVDGVYVDKKGDLMARMSNGTECSFFDLTIGKVVSITDELLYRLKCGHEK